MPGPAPGRGRDACRQLFDDLAFRVVGFLESHSAACDIALIDHPGVTSTDISSWEAKNRPFTLPEDYKGFLAVSNGVTVRWRLRFRDEEVPFGLMHVNQLEQVRALPARELGNIAQEAGAGSHVAAFDLDAECAEGRVALCYRGAGDGAGGAASDDGAGGVLVQQPEVWFQDMSCQWHFMAKSFTDYFRLVAAHLGVPQWHYAFTEAGLGPATRHWLAFFCPQRLEVATKRRLTQHMLAETSSMPLRVLTPSPTRPASRQGDSQRGPRSGGGPSSAARAREDALRRSFQR